MKTKEIDEKLENPFEEFVVNHVRFENGKAVDCNSLHGLAKLLKWFYKEEIKPELSTLRQSVLEEVREKMPKQRTENDDELSARDNVENEGFNRCHDQVTSLINELAEEEK